MPTSVYHTSQRETAHNLATAEAEKYKEFAPPSFVSLTKPVEGKSYPDALNPPLSARDNRLPPSHLAGAPAMRSGFTISDAALSRLLAPTNGHKSKASSSRQRKSKHQPAEKEHAPASRERASKSKQRKNKQQAEKE